MITIFCLKIFFKTALFAGGEPISQIIESGRYDLTMVNQEIKLPIQIDQRFEFNISVKNLPKSSKFCFCLFYTKKNLSKSSYAFGFISTNLFDYENLLINGRKKLFMWSIDSSIDTFENICKFHSIGN